MIIVFLSGFLGFFVFDVYRMYSYKLRDGHLIITFNEFNGLAAHSILYAAAGFLGLITNIDTLVQNAVSLTGSLEELSELSGSILRSFSLGILGPAGLKKSNTNQKMGPGIDDTPVKQASFVDFIRYFLMR